MTRLAYFRFTYQMNRPHKSAPVAFWQALRVAFEPLPF